VYVDVDAVGAGTGANWADAYTSLDDALAASEDGDQVWVAEGVYRPSVLLVANSPRTATFSPRAGAAVYGGFAGGETSLAEQDPDGHPTILSGDIGVPAAPGDNAFHVVTTAILGASTRLDGLTIRDGMANGPSVSQQRGAGLYAQASTVLVDNCRFEQNASTVVSAAATFQNGGDAQLIGCTFEGNSSGFGAFGAQVVVRDCDFRGQASSSLRIDALGNFQLFFEVRGCTFADNAGAGLVALNSAQGLVADCSFGPSTNSALASFDALPIELRDCTFTGNAAPINGGAAALQSSQRTTFTRCTFTGNSAASSGGAIFAYASPVSLVGCLFEGNSSALAGGAVNVYLESQGGQPGRSRLVGCTFLANASDEGGAVAAVGGNNGFEVVASNPVLANCVFSGNTATRGAALYAGGASAPELHVSTLSGNTATIAGGGVFGEVAGLIVPASPAIAVRNGILWGNADAGGSGESAQLSVSSGTLDVQRSCVQGWTGALGGAGNHGLDPLFVDADGPDDVDGTQDDQVHVFSGSPCIDAGDAAWLPADVEDLDCDGDVGEALALDVARVARVDDDPFTADTGVGPAPVPDMGAFEASAWTHAGHALAGAGGEPCLVGQGTLLGGTPMGLALHNAAPGAPATLAVGLSTLLAPFKGGVFVPHPDVLLTGFLVSGAGDIALAAPWPVGLAPGVSVWMQWWIVDAGGPVGFAASNGLRATTP
jgi:predicted outer membrane repeat protein